MKYLPIPLINDVQKTTDVSNNVLLSKTSYPHLRNLLPNVLQQYENYVQQQGNAWLLGSIPVSDDLKKGLLKNYASPPKSLSYLKEIRSSSPDICPMCGSLKPYSLDHVFPKEDYPELAIFSKNLVPACDCNIKRKTTLKGDAVTQERVLHPYFDTCFQTRQVSCCFTSIDNFRLIDVSIEIINPQHHQYSSINFHVENIVKPSGIVNWLVNEWIKLKKTPPNIIQTIPTHQLPDQNKMKEYLLDALSRYDNNYGTPNNWHSIFVHGIVSSPGVLDWLFHRHNDILAGNIDPLLE